MKSMHFPQAGAPLAAAALVATPSSALAAYGDLNTQCCDFVSVRPDQQAQIVRDILSARGVGYAVANSRPTVDSIASACQADLGSPVAKYIR